MAILTSFSDYLFMIQAGPAVLESVAVLAIPFDDPEMRIIFASPLLEEMFGYEMGELKGQLLEVLLRPEDRAIHLEHFAAFRKAPRNRTMNAGIWVDGLRKDATMFKVQISICTRYVGKERCVIACVADVTAAYENYRPDVGKVASDPNPTFHG